MAAKTLENSMSVYYLKGKIATALTCDAAFKVQADELEIVVDYSGYFYTVKYAGETIFKVEKYTVGPKFTNAGQQVFELKFKFAGEYINISRKFSLLETVKIGFELCFYPDRVSELAASVELMKKMMAEHGEEKVLEELKKQARKRLAQYC